MRVKGRARCDGCGQRSCICAAAQLLVLARDARGPLAVAHTAAGLDVALIEPVLPAAPPGGGHLVDACRSCAVTAHLEPIDGATALVLVHEASCARLARLLAGAGEPR